MKFRFPVMLFALILTLTAHAQAPVPSMGNGEYQVVSGDTLWNIAQKIRPAGASMPQVIAAIKQANPRVFINNKNNLLKQGTVLRLPILSGINTLSNSGASSNSGATSDGHVKLTSVDSARLNLASVNAMVIDTRTNEVLYSNNSDAVVPIASISKLMTAMVMLDANQPMDEKISVQIDQTRELKNVFSRLRVGSVISRRDMLLMTLMSSENRAAASLAHHYTGGYDAFISAMNTKAKALGMTNTHFVEPTGLSEKNVSSARDLTLMVKAASGYKLIKELSTTPKKYIRFAKPSYTLAFYNTNPLIQNHSWNIQLTKTGFINEAGRCLVMLTNINDRPLIMVLLDSYGKRSHVGDASRIRYWLETGNSTRVPTAAKAYHQRKLSALGG
ncbi:MAG: D-alanyl-D-alanine endopeptidase [Porticoccaceae bacterium]